MTKWIRLLVACLVLFASGSASAITCSLITAPGFSLNYVNNTTMSVQTYFRVTCSRVAGDAATSVTYSVTANNGQNNNGQNNNAVLGAAALRYDVYTNAGCSTKWKGSTAITDTISWAGGATGSITKDTTFWGCIVTAQTATTSGTYTDSVTLTLSYTGGTSITGSVPVSIYAPAVCTFTSAPNPSTISLAYTPFGAQKQGTSSFSVQCTSGMPYTLATNVTEGVLLNLRYILSLSATSDSGSGSAKPYTVTVTFPAGQAGGSCGGGSCSDSASHTITISY